MLDDNGQWLQNVTCPVCRHRHPAQWTCLEAQDAIKALDEALAALQQPADPEAGQQAWLDAFIERAGFRWGWKNLESSGRMMARQAYVEVESKEGAK